MARDNNDDQWEEEEALVLVELSGVIDYDMITSSDPSKCNILGADTDQPLLQMDRCVFVGEYQEAMGTVLLFEEGSEPRRGEAGDSGDGKTVTYFGKTSKQLAMKRAFVSEKGEGQASPFSTDIDLRSPSGSEMPQDLTMSGNESSAAQTDTDREMSDHHRAVDTPT